MVRFVFGSFWKFHLVTTRTDRPWHKDRRFRALPTFSWKRRVRRILPKSLFDRIIAAAFPTATMATAQIVTGKRTGTRAIIAKACKKVALCPDMRDRWVTCETWASTKIRD